MQTRELREQRAKLYEQAKELLEKAEGADRDLTSEERTTYDRLEKEQLSVKERIDRQESSDSIGRELAQTQGRQSEIVQVADRSDDVNRAFRAWLSPQDATSDQLEAAERMGINPASRELEMRALDGTDTSAGGYSVPDEMMRAFWDAQLFFANIRPKATVWRTATGADLPIPTVDDTGNTGVIIGQNTAVTTTADPVFGQVTLGAFKYSSKAVLVPVELLQDSFINLPVYLGSKLGERIGRIQATHFATGTGTGEPQGVVDVSSVGKTAAVTNAITFDEIIDLTHSLDIAYRPRAEFMMHDTIASVLRKLKDSNDQYLWQMSLQAGQPDRLFGIPVNINNNMESVLDTANIVVLYGDFSTYYIRDAGDVILARANERWIDTHQVGFLAFQRTDAKGISTSTIKHLITA